MGYYIRQTPNYRQGFDCVWFFPKRIFENYFDCSVTETCNKEKYFVSEKEA